MNNKKSSFQDLIVWQKSFELSVLIYNETKNFPKDEIYGITQQIRKSAVSIPSNIAEGAARKGAKEFSQFIHIALGSLAELKTQMMIANRVGYLSVEKLNFIIQELEQISIMLIKLRNSIEAKNN